MDDHDHSSNSNSHDNSNEPLLSSFFQKSVKIGPFPIRYDNPSSPRAKSSKLYEHSSSSGQFHDFNKSNDSHLYDDDDDEIDDHDDDDESDSHHHSKQSKLSIMSYFIFHKLEKSQLSCCKIKFLPLRILLLAFYLAFTLSSFWLLDSIKEPTLAILVKGELGKHQPRAKMVSFVVVVFLACGMEWMDQLRLRSRIQSAATVAEDDDAVEDVNAALERSWADRNLPNSMRNDNETSGGRRWRKMGIRTSELWKKHFHWSSYRNEDSNETDKNASSSKITTLAFYIVGSLYIHAFVVVAVALREHPSFRPKDSSSASSSSSATMDSAHNNDWYSTTLGYALFALIESFGSVSITIFWAFANSHLTLEAAERHYGSIIALAQGGAIAGSTLSAVLGRRREHDASVEENDAIVTPMLIFLACGCIGAGMAIMALYAQLFSKPMRPSADQQIAPDGIERIGEDHDHPPIIQSKLHQHTNMEGNSSSSTHKTSFSNLFGGVRMIFRHEYLKLVLAVSVLYEIALTCMHYEMNLLGLDRFGLGMSIVDESDFNDEKYTTDHATANSDKNNSSITYIQFMGWYGQTVNILSLFLSFYAFPYLIKNYGLRNTIRVFPTVLLFVTIFAFVLFPQNLYFLFISLSVCKALTYSVHDPSEEVLYMPTSDDAKFRAKFWIDVVGQRIAKAIGSAINNYAGSVEGIVKYGGLPSVAASLALWLACYQVGPLFDRLIKSGEVVGLEEEQYDEGEGLELCEGVYDEDESDDDPGLEHQVTPTSFELNMAQTEMKINV